jgi:hypothetical protein
MPRTVIEIVNPLPGGQCFTSATRAKQYCDSGIAYMLKDGRLQFRAAFQAKRERSDVYVKGQVWWNGNDLDQLAMHKPGEVVS